MLFAENAVDPGIALGGQTVTPKGFYRRRRGILEHLQNGTITLFDAAVHDFLCLNAQSRVGIGSALPPGVWIGSAIKIWLLTGRHDCDRKIQRSLEKLERLGWIRRFFVQGRKGDYPILISRFVVADGCGNDFIVNADATIDWQNPILEPIDRTVGDASVKRRGIVTEVSPLLQDLENGGKGNTEPSARSQAGSVDDFEAFWKTYPLKVAKQDAKKAWKKLKAAELPALFKGLEAWKQSEQWTKEGGQYIPHASTFLNGRRWEDEVPSFTKDADIERGRVHGPVISEAALGEGPAIPLSQVSRVLPRLEREAEAHELWGCTLAQLRRQVDLHTFSTWFGPLAALGFASDGSLILATKNERCARYLRSKWKARIVGIAGGPVDFVIAEHEAVA